MSAMRARSSSSLREGGSCSFGASVDWEDVARGGAMLCPIAFCHSRRSTAGAPALMSVREGGVLGDGVRNRATSVIHLSFSQATHASITVATRDGAEIAKFNTGLVAAGCNADFIVLEVPLAAMAAKW